MSALHSPTVRAGGFSKVTILGFIVAGTVALLGAWWVPPLFQATAAAAVSAPISAADAVATPEIAPVAPVAPKARFADFGSIKPSAEARYLADWIADSNDNGDLDFFVVDKKGARVYVFNSTATLRATSPVLVGSAVGDDSFPGIGLRPIAQVKPFERTTPAGRFMAERGRNTTGEDIIWIDYDAAVSMHRVRTNNARERRLERLATPTSDDNRISYGCINVPVVFYERFIRPVFTTRRALVYVLPDLKSAQLLFGAYDVAAKHGLALPSPAAPR